MVEASIKVRLDTKPAQQDLRKLGREGQAAAGRVNAKLNREGGGFGAGLGVGAAVGGFSRRLAGQVKGSIFGAAGDVAGEAAAFAAAKADETIGGSDARISRSTREQAAELFGGITRDTGDTSLAKEWQSRVLPFRQQVGRGQVAIRKDLSPGAEAQEAIIEAISEGFEKLFEGAKDLGNSIMRTLGMGGGR